MTESVTTAVAKRKEAPGTMIEGYRQDFSLVLPSQIKAETWMRLAQGLLRQDEKLAAAAMNNPGALVSALLECARLGHEPGTDRFYLVPLKGVIEGWEGYKGVIQRMLRGGQVRNVKAAVVRANDRFAYDPETMDRPVHKVDWFGDRGKILGSYAYAVMQDGSTSQVAIADQEYIQKVRAMQPSSNNATSPWVKWEESMVLKCAFNRLEPFVDTSSEDRRITINAKADAEVIRNVAPMRQQIPATDVPPTQNKVLEGEVVDEDAVTLPQLNKLHVQLSELEITDRADKLTTVGLLAGRPDLESSKDLTKLEASSVIDLLERVLADADPQKALDGVLAALEENDSAENGS